MRLYCFALVLCLIYQFPAIAAEAVKEEEIPKHRQIGKPGISPSDIEDYIKITRFYKRSKTVNLVKKFKSRSNVFKEVNGNLLKVLNLQKINLSGMNLENVDLTMANMDNANLSGANLRDSLLQHASLQAAKLMGADLRGANLSKANLEQANLTGAMLTNANLFKANIKDVVGLTDEEYEKLRIQTLIYRSKKR